MEKIRSYKELRVYQATIEAAMKIFELTKSFPVEEKYSMTDQMRRSSRSVCANIRVVAMFRINNLAIFSIIAFPGKCDEFGRNL